MVVIGIAIIGGMLYRRQFLSTLPIALIFFGIPVVVELGLSWNNYVPLLLIGLGLLSLVDALRRNQRRGIQISVDGNVRRFEYRSGFWPVVFLGVGTIWLLGNLGYLPRFDLYALISLWPLLLVGLGLDLLIGRRSLWIGALIGLATLATAGFLMYTRSDLLPKAELQTAHFSEPLGQASSAELILELNGGRNQVAALDNPDTLIDAQLTYLGTVNFSVSGEQAKRIELTQSGAPVASFLLPQYDQQSTLIGMSTAVPAAISLENTDGDTLLDLGEIQLAGLDYRVSGGNITTHLPATSGSLHSAIDQSGGDLTIQCAPGAAAVFRVEMSGGELVLDVPQGMPVRVEVLGRSGGEVVVPENFEQIQGGVDGEGTWETPGFTQSEQSIVITVEEISGGEVTVQ